MTDKRKITFENEETGLAGLEGYNEPKEKAYNLIINNVDEAIVLNKYDKKINKSTFEINKNAKKLFELQQDDFSDFKLFNYLPEKQLDGQNSLVKFRKIHDSRKSFESITFDWQFLSKKNNLILTKLTIVRFKDDDFYYNIFIIKDETSITKYKTEALTKESLFKNLFENNNQGVVIVTFRNNDPDDVINKIYNKRIYEILKIKDKDYKIKTLTDYFPLTQPDGRPSLEAYEYYQKMIAYERKAAFDWKFIDMEGNAVFCVLNCQIVIINDNLSVSFTKILDITQQKKDDILIKNQVSKLKEKNKELQQYIDSNKSLENFAFKAAHDLKTPLRNISGFSQLLKKSVINKLNEEEKEYINFVLEASKKMQFLINDILDYARVDRQEKIIDEISLINIFDIIEKKLNYLITSKNAKIKYCNIPDKIIGNTALYIKLFYDLIKNGLDHSDENRPARISINCLEKENRYLFSVSDNGIGIEEKYYNIIFEPFRKLSPENKRSGIGLANCKNIVEQLGGKIWVESKVNEGSTFFLTINK